MSPFPHGFFDRVDDTADDRFYSTPRLVTHIDDGAILAVGRLYRELDLGGEVLDICSSWISHFDPPPARLVALGMSASELARNRSATDWVVHDLNVDPTLPFPDASFDAVTCCVSVDYLTRPVDVFADVGRVLRVGSPFVVTFSNRCFPTKVIRGWATTDDRGHCLIVETYFEQAGVFEDPVSERQNPVSTGDPLYSVVARRREPAICAPS